MCFAYTSAASKGHALSPEREVWRALSRHSRRSSSGGRARRRSAAAAAGSSPGAVPEGASSSSPSSSAGAAPLSSAAPSAAEAPPRVRHARAAAAVSSSQGPTSSAPKPELGTTRPPKDQRASRYTWCTTMPFPLRPVCPICAALTAVEPTATGSGFPCTRTQRLAPAGKGSRPPSGTMSPGSIMSAPLTRNLLTGPCVCNAGSKSGMAQSA
mmetsp:Transcript_10112/g.34379  ORF Transcript_10112/g.34379 Transcript_10112/m.34379 type:complete len:212 (-) Transcript_10112:370-1005(-)